MSGQKLYKRNYCEDIMNSKEKVKENMVAWYKFAVGHKSDSKSHYFFFVLT